MKTEGITQIDENQRQTIFLLSNKLVGLTNQKSLEKLGI
jgi:hypothetical protein